jgi:molybdopterin-guanine dinucleotide biosynthesis protein A
MCVSSTHSGLAEGNGITLNSKSHIKNPLVAILAGGRSRRMGRDKALLSHGKSTWLEHTAYTALQATSEVVVIGRTCPTDWPLQSVHFLPDAVLDSGPLGGVLTALRRARDSASGPTSVLALGCDMPRLTIEALHWVFEAAATMQLRHGLAVRNAEHIEPLFSIYTVACLPLVEQRLRTEGETARCLSLQALIESADFAYVDAPPAIAAMLHNINTPQQLQDLHEERSTT